MSAYCNFFCLFLAKAIVAAIVPTEVLARARWLEGCRGILCEVLSALLTEVWILKCL